MANDGVDDDGSSVNLLLMSSHDEDDATTVCFSPATQTLNSLSQNAVDLRSGSDGLSKMDLDMAAALIHVRNDKTMRISPPKPSRVSSWNNNDSLRFLSAVSAAMKPPTQRCDQQDKMTFQEPFSTTTAAAKRTTSKKPDTKRPHRRTECQDFLQISVATGKSVAKFSSYTDAERALGCRRQTVSKILQGELEQWKGWTFRFHSVDGNHNRMEAEDEKGDHQRKKVPSKPRMNRNHEPSTSNASTTVVQVCAATGKTINTYRSNTAAGKAVGCDSQTISKIIDGEIEQFSGFSFRLSTVETSTEQKVQSRPRKRSKSKGHQRAIPIQQFDATTGVHVATHPSILVASEKSGANRHKVYAVLRGELPSWNGHVWKYGKHSSIEDEPKQRPRKKFKASHAKEAVIANSQDTNTQGSRSRAQRKDGNDSVRRSEACQIDEEGGIASTKRTTKVSSASSLVQKESDQDVAKGKRDGSAGKGKTSKKFSSRSIPILQFNAETGALVATYSSIKCASTATGTNRHKIYAVLKGEMEEFSGMIWKYHEPEPAQGEVSTNSTKSKSISMPAPLSPASQTTEVAEPEPEPAPEPAPETEPEPTPGPALEQNPQHKTPARSIPIQEFDSTTGQLLTVYSSISVASGKSGINRHKIYAVLDGELSEFGGKIWKRCGRESERSTSQTSTNTLQPTSNEQAESKTDGSKLPDRGNDSAECSPVGMAQENELKIKPHKPKNGKSTPIQQFDSNGRFVATYNSISVAASESGVGRHLILSVLNGDIEDWNGTRWCHGTEQAESITGVLGNPLDYKEARASPKPRVSSDYLTDVPNATGNAVLEELGVPTPEKEPLENPKGLSSAQQQLLLSTSKSCSAVDTTVVQEESSDDDFTVVRVSVEEYGPLGLNVTEGKAPRGLVDILHRDHNLGFSDSQNSSSMFVSSFKKEGGSPASRAGIRVSDWLFLLEESTGAILMDYSDVRNVVATGTRPICFLVGRGKGRKSSRSSDESSTRTSSSKQSRIDKSDSASGPPYPANFATHSTQFRSTTTRDPPNGSAQASISISDAERGQKLNARSDLFDAKPELGPASAPAPSTMQFDRPRKLKNDVSIVSKHPDEKSVPFCACCRKNKQGVHHAWCPKNCDFGKSGADAVLRRIRRGVEMGCPSCVDEYKTGRRFKGDHSIECRQSRRADKKTGGQLYNSCSRDNVSSDEASAGENEDGSVFGVNPRSRRIPTFRFVAPKAKATQPSRGGKKKGASMSIPHQHETKKTKPIGHPKKKEPSAHDSGPKATVGTSPQDDKVHWKPCPNPWGTMEVLPGDEIIFSSFKKTKHFSSAPRFSAHPFAANDYKDSHMGPDCGFQVVVLNRSSSLEIPWGFNWKIHDFGGACIVTSVEVLSPANTATFLATDGSIPAPLRVKDIILSVNGRAVGGMTQNTLETELQVAGSRLVLVVARYRFPDKVQKQLIDLETHVYENLDSLLGDKAELDWIDYGELGLVEGLPKPSIRADVLSKSTVKDFNPEVLDPAGSPGSCEGTTSYRCADDALTSGDTSTVQNEPVAPALDSPIVDRSLDPSDERSLLSNIAPLSGSSRREQPLASSVPWSPRDLTNQMRSASSKRQLFAKCARSTVEPTSNSSVESKSDDDDGNAWFGCICGVVHKKNIPVFWIQCDGCDSWYNVSSSCVGLDQSEAAALSSWCCKGCEAGLSPVTFSGEPNYLHSPMAPDQIDETSSIPRENDSGHQDTVLVCDSAKKPRTKENCSLGNSLKKGDMVMVAEHAWTGVNNPEGAARVITESYLDDDGDVVYDIKYIVGSKKKGVLEEYLKPWSFS